LPPKRPAPHIPTPTLNPQDYQPLLLGLLDVNGTGSVELRNITVVSASPVNTTIVVRRWVAAPARVGCGRQGGWTGARGRGGVPPFAPNPIPHIPNPPRPRRYLPIMRPAHRVTQRGGALVIDRWDLTQARGRPGGAQSWSFRGY
jgi:hypothetical protein